jgi:hypothetical protein
MKNTNKHRYNHPTIPTAQGGFEFRGNIPLKSVRFGNVSGIVGDFPGLLSVFGEGWIVCRIKDYHALFKKLVRYNIWLNYPTIPGGGYIIYKYNK